MECEYGEAYSPLGWPASLLTIQTGEWSDDTRALRMKMAERRGHAPHAARGRHDLVSNKSRLAGPVDVPLWQGVMASSHHYDGRMPSLLELALPEGLCRSCGCASSAPHLMNVRYRAQRSPPTSAFEARRSIL